MQVALQRVKPFDVRRSLVRAAQTLSEPPAKPHIVRPPALGALVAQFVLPLELCKPMNQIARTGMASQAWRIGKLKEDCFLFMLAQARTRQRKTLDGRPQVIAVRFSSSEPDRWADWAKNPVDRLCVGPHGLGYLVDDRPTAAQVEQHWEPAKRGEGFVYLEVRTGAEV